MKTILLSFTAFAAAITTSQGALFQFDLIGIGGPNLIASNEVTSGGAPATILGTPGNGVEILGGFVYDDVLNTFTINFSWTALQGASAGSVGSAVGFHIHGPVTTPNPMLSTAGVLHNLIAGTAGGGAVPNYTFLNNANGTGQVTGFISNVPVAQGDDLKAGRWYVNVHSALNSGGEIRGNLVLVPEPGTASVAALGLLGLTMRRRRA